MNLKRLLCLINWHDWFVISGHDGAKTLTGKMRCLVCNKRVKIEVGKGGIKITKEK